MIMTDRYDPNFHSITYPDCRNWWNGETVVREQVGMELKPKEG
jgi:hypothetical protein